MTSIRILTDEVTNQIAAGEVVENPASVVKELVENAVDAGASQIKVSIEEGGLSFIGVQDDGQGMTREDMKLSFLRHATSKIRTSSDLFSLTTMGFRGEALPSIAAVSRLELISRSQASDQAHYLFLEGGLVKEERTQSFPKGSYFKVKDLFFNTPVRKKFLRSSYKEGQAVRDLMQKLALSRLDISFSLQLDDKLVFQTSGQHGLKEALAQIYSLGLIDKLIPIKKETDFFRIQGLIGPSYQYRSSRDMQIFFINHRYVRSPLLEKTLAQAYRHRIPQRKYPVAIVNIDMNPASIDVNIHPSKTEVKFSMEKAIQETLKDLFLSVLDEQVGVRPLEGLGQRRRRSTLEKDLSAFTPPLSRKSEAIQGQPEQTSDKTFDKTSEKPADKPADKEREAKFGLGVGEGESVNDRWALERALEEERRKKEGPGKKSKASYSASSKQAPLSLERQETLFFERKKREEGPFHSQPHSQPESQVKSDAKTHAKPQAISSLEGEGERREADFPQLLSELRLLCVIARTYLVMEKEDQLYLIDQHAAHERIRYERLYADYQKEKLKCQFLLEPVLLLLSPQEKNMVTDNINDFLPLGMVVELLGEDDFLLRSLPSGFEDKEGQALFLEVLYALDKGEESLKERLLERASCHGSIRSGDSIREDEVHSLLAQLAKCRQPTSCPHGRPTLLVLGKKELEKLFLRE